MIKLILPQDTRDLELLSSFSLIITALFVFLSGTNITPLTEYPALFWASVTLIFGLLQFLSTAYSEKLHTVKTAMSWFAGGFWVWLSLAGLMTVPSPYNFVTLFLGLGNFCAFILNLNLLRKDWNT